ncbi:MAG: aspartate ammonia-lyase, partial [Clostridia bacterium]|nr:aspartate ammonia-lyase [Clostridia bacterium]
LNAFEPVVLYWIFESITCLANAIKTLTVNCIVGIAANAERCKEETYGSIGIVTALCPYLGYKKCAALAKEAAKKGVRIKELVLSYGLMDEAELDKILDPYSMT